MFSDIMKYDGKSFSYQSGVSQKQATDLGTVGLETNPSKP